MKLKYLTRFIPFALLSACATYQAPTSGPTATIKFSGNQYYVYIDAGYSPSCSTNRRVDGKEWDRVVIPAERKIIIQQGIDTSGTAFGVMCGFVFEFIPEAGAEYESAYTFSYPNCDISVFSIDKNGNKRVPTTLKKSEESYYWCL